MRKRGFFSGIVPLGTFVFLLVADRPFPDFLPGLTGSELGLLESVQAVVLLCAIGMAGVLLFQRGLSCPPWVRAWIAAGLVGTVYVFLEEISYGQHYFNWNTPGYWQEINDQHETNLHNTSSWLDQKPRLLLELGVLVGGIIVPLLRRFKPSALPGKLKPILPDSALFITALLAILPRIYERVIALAGLDHWNLFVRTSEVQEFYFFYFVLLYFVFLRSELRSAGRKDS